MTTAKSTSLVSAGNAHAGPLSVAAQPVSTATRADGEERPRQLVTPCGRCDAWAGSVRVCVCPSEPWRAVVRGPCARAGQHAERGTRAPIFGLTAESTRGTRGAHAESTRGTRGRTRRAGSFACDGWRLAVTRRGAAGSGAHLRRRRRRGGRARPRPPSSRVNNPSDRVVVSRVMPASVSPRMKGIGCRARN
jgi:hypothetical protein